MGSDNSACLIEILTVLHQNECNQMHPIWQKISVDNFSAMPDESTIIRLLSDIKKLHPMNFSILIFCLVDAFAKSIKLFVNQTSNTNFVTFCRFLQLLMTVSGDDPQWFRNGNGVLNQNNSVSVLVEMLFKLLNFNQDNLVNILKNPVENINYAITLLYISNAAAFNVIEVKDDPSLFIKAFDIINPKGYLETLLEFIISCFQNKKIQDKIIYLIRTHLTLILPVTYSSEKWGNAIKSIDNRLLYNLFLLMTLHNSNIIECIEQIISLFYIVVSKNEDFVTFLEINGKLSVFITSLLFYFQYKMEKGVISYLHTIILILLSILTSKKSALLQLNEPLNLSLPKMKTTIISNTIGDLLIEVLTNVLNLDLEMNKPIIPLVVGILTNICSTTVNISKNSSNRLYDFLNFFFLSKISENNEFIPIIDKLLIIIFDLTRVQTLGNHNLLINGLDELMNLNTISETEQWKSSCEKLIKILIAVETPLNQSTSKEEKKIEVHNELSKILKTFEDIPFPKQSEITFSRSMQAIWYDWFRYLFYELIPFDASKYNLSFASFSIYEKGNIKVNERKPSIQIEYIQDNEIENDDNSENEILVNSDENIYKEPQNTTLFEDETIYEFKNQTEPTDKPFGEDKDFIEFLNSS